GGLRGATMSDNHPYDGRFNLRRDAEYANGLLLDAEDPQEMADFYSVPVEVYCAGQEWARENLPRLRREAGLEQEQTAETGDAQ
ncbi:MAG: hypothetical protein ACJ8CR_22005, partial [Roseiflexaceae bacterium]